MSDIPTQSSESPWHAGEVELQRKVGVADQMVEVGKRFIRDFMPEQHRQFFAQLPFMVVGAVNDEGDIWATIRTGQPGFVGSPDNRTLVIGARRDEIDPADLGMAAGKAVGLIGIDLSTRRRNRMNGFVIGNSDKELGIQVEQSFGNCPSYIQRRVVEIVRDPQAAPTGKAINGHALDARARRIVGAADTFFVATYVDLPEKRQVDVSHRGGKPGFIRIDADGGLTIPDFAGNSFFNTLGNILLNKKTGLLFADFSSGDVLQLSGDAEVILESPAIAAFQGAERLWKFSPRHVVFRENILPLRWTNEPDGQSPACRMTGNWDDAARKLAASAYNGIWRKLRVVKIVEESSSVKSFYLEPCDDAGLAPFAAGQHLSVRVGLDGERTPSVRSYTLSTAPADNEYRISVKRGSEVSRYIFDSVQVGDLIDTLGPAGTFTIDALERRPAVLLAAGIGITPLLSMLRHVVYEGWRKRQIRPTWLFYSAHDLADRAFGTELQEITKEAQGAIHIVRSLTDITDAKRGLDYEASGRIDLDLLRGSLPFDDYDFYLCGPLGFMQSMYDGLRGLNVAESRIHAESFSTSGLKRGVEASAAGDTARQPATEPVAVEFNDTATVAEWLPGETLLELAERCSIQASYGCRAGRCGNCRTALVSGEVAYMYEPEFKTLANEALICCAVPAAETVAPLKLAL
jgi:uncharacterized protein